MGLNFLDTYALIDAIAGKGEIAALLDEGVMLDVNLAEVHYGLLRLYNRKTADHFFEKLRRISKPLPQRLIPAAMEFRFKKKLKRFSYADALGFTFAQEQGIPFVTGNDAFKGMKSVRLLE